MPIEWNVIISDRSNEKNPFCGALVKLLRNAIETFITSTPSISMIPMDFIQAKEWHFQWNFSASRSARNPNFFQIFQFILIVAIVTQ